jgi:hypothetical protein
MFGRFSKLLRPLWISDLIVVEIYDGYFLAVFYFAFAELVQTWPPLRILFQVIGDALGEEDVSSNAAIHYSLRDIDSGAGNVGLFIQVSDFIDRTAVNAHTNVKFRMIL